MAKARRITRRGRPVDQAAAGRILAETFSLAEDDYQNRQEFHFPITITNATDYIFSSKTAAYRDSLPSCVIARIIDSEIDITSPQTTGTMAGPNSFSGRSLWENVVAPFFGDHAIPASVTPFLSSVRGGARLIEGGAPRVQRDPAGFDALVKIVTYLCEGDEDRARKYLRYLLGRFIQLRDEGDIALRQIVRPNLEQLHRLIEGLLTVKSGGRLPALLATSMFQTISECHGLGWDIDFQGINVADKVSGAVGDITVRKADEIILGVEVTERAVDGGRVTLVFDQKISPRRLDDYLFIVTAPATESALTAALRYTAVGHEMNFVPLVPWLVHNLATLGVRCRALFQSKAIDLIRTQKADLKVAWNNQMSVAIGIANLNSATPG